jgi:hypothetical protein
VEFSRQLPSSYTLRGDLSNGIITQERQLENNSLPLRAVTIWGNCLVVAEVLRLANIPDLASACLLKKMECLTIGVVIPDSTIPSQPLHVTFLTFSGVPEDPIWLHAVMVAELLTSFTGEQENEWLGLGSTNTTLTLRGVLMPP